MGAAYYKYISRAHCERVIMLHSGGTRCEVSQLQQSWHAVSRVLLSVVLEPTQLRPVWCLYAKPPFLIIAHVRMMSSSARAMRVLQNEQQPSHVPTTNAVSVSESLQPRSTHRFACSPTSADILHQNRLPKFEHGIHSFLTPPPYPCPPQPTCA